MKKIVFIALLLLSCFAKAQLPYTQPLFQYDSLMNVVYGTETDYAGNPAVLTMDIYRPTGDLNCFRPVIVLVHGGAWIGGSKEDVDLVYMSRFFARRGWVVANINYRLGTHKAANYTMYAACNNSVSQPCGYISDSSEVYRANFRAMQDAKGAIRFMKNRSAIDSSDVNNVFISGQSAGGFIALAAAFTDQPSEKSIDCFAIANAPNPDSDMATYGCIPSQISYARPDLGSIDGTLNIGTNDATVKGVGNIFGGVLNTGIFTQAADTPCVYLYHQGSDVVVHYNYGILLGRTSWECYAQVNLCQTYYFYPRAYGSEGIRQHFVSLGANAPVYQADIVSNYAYMNNCFSNGHSFDNIQLRTQNMIDLFASKISASDNDPAVNCATVNVEESFIGSELSLYPNPTAGKVFIKASKELAGAGYHVADLAGRTVLSGIVNNNAIEVNALANGLYLLHIEGYSGALRLVKKN